MNKIKLRLNFYKTLFSYEYMKYRDKLCLEIAHRLPKRLVLWCFIIVFGANGKGASKEYSDIHDYWQDKYKLID